MKIRPVGAQLFHEDRRTDRHMTKLCCVPCVNFISAIQLRSKDSQVKTQLVLWIFTLFKVTTCFGLYHQSIIRSQVNSRTFRKLDTVIYKNQPHRLKLQRDLVVILYDSVYIYIFFFSCGAATQCGVRPPNSRCF